MYSRVDNGDSEADASDAIKAEEAISRVKLKLSCDVHPFFLALACLILSMIQIESCREPSDGRVFLKMM